MLFTDNILNSCMLCCFADYDRSSQSKRVINKIDESLEIILELANDEAFKEKPIVILFNKVNDRIYSCIFRNDNLCHCFSALSSSNTVF